MLSDYADPAIKADGVSNEHKSQVQEVTAGVEDDKAKTDKVVSELDTVVDGLESIKMHLPPQSRRKPAHKPPKMPEVLTRSAPDELFDNGWKRTTTTAPPPPAPRKPLQDVAAKLKAAEEASRSESPEDTQQQLQKQEIADIFLHPRNVPKKPLTKPSPQSKVAPKLPNADAARHLGAAAAQAIRALSAPQPSRIRIADQGAAVSPGAKQLPQTSVKRSPQAQPTAASHDAGSVQPQVPDVLPVVQEMVDPSSDFTEQLIGSSSDVSYPQVEHTTTTAQPAGVAGINLSPEEQSILQSLDGMPGLPSSVEQPSEQPVDPLAEHPVTPAQAQATQIQAKAQAQAQATQIQAKAQAEVQAAKAQLQAAKAKLQAAHAFDVAEAPEAKAVADARAKMIKKANAEQARAAALAKAQAKAKAEAERKAREKAQAIEQAKLKRQAALKAVQDQRSQIDNLQQKIQQEKSAQSNGLNAIEALSSKFTSLFQR